MGWLDRADRHNQERMDQANRRRGGDDYDDDTPSWTEHGAEARGVLAAVVAFVILGLCIYGLVMLIASGM